MGMSWVEVVLIALVDMGRPHLKVDVSIFYFGVMDYVKSRASLLSVGLDTFILSLLSVLNEELFQVLECTVTWNCVLSPIYCFYERFLFCFVLFCFYQSNKK